MASGEGRGVPLATRRRVATVFLAAVVISWDRAGAQPVGTSAVSALIESVGPTYEGGWIVMDQDAPAGGRRLLLLGDSVANGLGVRDRRYGKLIASRLGLDLIDLSHTGWTVADSLDALNRLLPDARADVALVAHGVTEAILRPTPRALKYLPSRWRRRGWMDPRPYYSRKLRKRLPEKIESAVRWRIKAFILHNTKESHRLMSRGDYADGVVALVQLLKDRGARVIVVGPPAIDSRYFPRSQEAQNEYRQELVGRGLSPIDIATRLNCWEDYFLDHFHPNESGHEKMADLLTPMVEQALLMPNDYPSTRS